MKDLISKGCTVGNSFTVPFTKDEVEVLYITYQHRGKTVIEKTLDDASFGDGTLNIKFTQEETFLFESFVRVLIQIRVKYKDGTVAKSNIIETTVDEILKDGVI